MGISSDKEIEVSTATGLKPSGKKFTIGKKAGGGYIIKNINNYPAVTGYLNLMDWSREVLDERLYRKVFYYPFIQSFFHRIM